MNKHIVVDKVENGFWCRYTKTTDKGESVETIVFETYEKLEKFTKKYLEGKT